MCSCRSSATISTRRCGRVSSKLRIRYSRCVIHQAGTLNYDYLMRAFSLEYCNDTITITWSAEYSCTDPSMEDAVAEQNEWKVAKEEFTITVLNGVTAVAQFASSKQKVDKTKLIIPRSSCKISATVVRPWNRLRLACCREREQLLP